MCILEMNGGVSLATLISKAPSAEPSLEQGTSTGKTLSAGLAWCKPEFRLCWAELCWAELGCTMLGWAMLS